MGLRLLCALVCLACRRGQRKRRAHRNGGGSKWGFMLEVYDAEGNPLLSQTEE